MLLSRHGVDRSIILGAEIGRGDHGVVYDVDWEHAPDTDVSHVLKITHCRTAEQQRVFEHEMSVSNKMWQIGVGPRVYNSWMEDTAGYCLMEKLSGIYGHTISEHDTRGGNVHVERAVIGRLERMIRSGYIHNDSHVYNVGFDNEGHVVLFDFGLTRRLDTHLDDGLACQILGFHLYQVIEKYDNTTLECTPMFSSLLYEVIYDIRNSTHTFGSYIQYADHRFEVGTINQR